MSTTQRTSGSDADTEDVAATDADPSGVATREQTNIGSTGGSSLGDGPPPVANGDQVRRKTEQPQGEYGGGYGGQPRPEDR